MAILECKGLCKSYGAEPALDRVDLSVEPGHIVGLLGPNGSGKSTLIKLANGLLTPDAGEILIDGMAPGKETKKIVSYLPERTYFADWMTALQLLAFFGDFYDDFDRDAAVQMMQRLGIQPQQRRRNGIRRSFRLFIRRNRAVHKDAHFLHHHAGAGFQILLDLLLQRGNRQRHADIRLQRNMNIHADALFIAVQRRGDNLQLRMLIEALVDQRFKRLERNANHAVFVALDGIVARTLLPGRQNHRKEQ